MSLGAKKNGIAKKLILTFRAIIISQEVDLVAGDFNGTAWQYRDKETKPLLIVHCLRHRALRHCGHLDPFRTIGQTCADFSNHLALNDFGKCINMVHFPFHGNPLVYVPPIKAAITKPGFIWTLLIGATRGLSKGRMNHAFP